MEILGLYRDLMANKDSKTSRSYRMARIKFWLELNGRFSSALCFYEQNLFYGLARTLNEAIPETKTAFFAAPTNAEWIEYNRKGQAEESLYHDIFFGSCVNLPYWVKQDVYRLRCEDLELI